MKRTRKYAGTVEVLINSVLYLSVVPSNISVVSAECGCGEGGRLGRRGGGRRGRGSGDGASTSEP